MTGREEIFVSIEANHSVAQSLPARDAPIRDALVVALLVLGSFVGSAFLVLWSVELREGRRIQDLTEIAAWKAYSGLQASTQRLNEWESPNAEKIGQIFQSILDDSPEVETLALDWGSDGDFEIVISSLHSQSVELSTIGDYAEGRGRVLLPVRLTAGGHTDGVLRVDSRPPGSTRDLIAARLGFASAAAIGTALAGLVGFLVFRSASRFHSTYNRLAEAEKRLRDVTEAAGEFVWEVDQDGCYTYLSDRVLDVTGYSPEELRGRHPIEFVPEEDSERVTAHFDHIRANKLTYRDFEHRMIRKDGLLIWLSLNGIPYQISESGLVGFRGTGLDVTVRKTGEEALRREKEAAQAATIAKSQFLAMMSHEIRTPLNSVLGFADLLSRTQLDAAQREHLNMILRSSDALLDLLSDILEFSRAEFSNLTLDPEPTCLRSFLSGVFNLHRPAAEAKGLRFDLHVDPSLPSDLLIDRARLRQIILNLVGNAVKFTEKGSVELRVERGTQSTNNDDGNIPLRFIVRDTGIGIPPEMVPMLFKPFSQGDPSTTRKFGGTGLGLAICRRLAKLFGGTVELVESRPGATTFALEFPCQPTDASPFPIERGRPTLPEAAEHRVPSRILVVEDNPASRRLMQLMLSPMADAVDIANHGLDALEKHFHQPYDLIFMDLQMPVMDGLQATREIRKHESTNPSFPHAVVIALTANALSGDRERCIQAGMSDYLSKPVRRDALLRAISRNFSA
ncbi:MAG: hypothetical protein Fur0032_00630 [Terrimicrobiaceae bacterium]